MNVRAQLLDDAAYASPDRLRARSAEGLQSAPSARSGLPIALRGLSKAFGARQVLRDFDLTIEAGEFVVVVGRSGGGKSTLLRLVAGLEQPSAGDRSPSMAGP